MNTAYIQMRIDAPVRKKAESVFNKMGMTLNDGIRVYLNQVIMTNGLPFRPAVIEEPNDETLRAFSDIDAGRTTPVDFDEFKKMLRC